MARCLHCVGVLVSTIAVCSCSRGPSSSAPETIRAELAEQQFDLKGSPHIPGGFSIGFPRTAVPLSEFTLPEGRREGLLYDLQWKKPLAGSRGERASSGNDKFTAFRSGRDIWVDWNRDGSFSASEQLVKLAESDGRRFYEPTGAPPGPDWQGVLLGYAGTGARRKGSVEEWISVAPATFLQTEVRLGGRSSRVKFIDGNLDGAIAPGRDIGDTGDYIWIDFGNLVDARHASLRDDRELGGWIPLRTHHYFPDGKYYVVKVSENLRELTLVPDPTPTGRIRIALDVVGPVTFSQGPEFTIVPVVDGQVVLRSGTYELSTLMYLVSDAKGNRWKLFIREPSSRYLTVSPGTVETISSKPPYVAGSKVYPEQGRQIVYLWIRDAEGNSVVPTEGLDLPLNPPKCTITDESGRTAFQAEMSMWGGDYIAAWSPPKGAKGDFNVGIRWPLSLWGDLQTATRFRL